MSGQTVRTDTVTVATFGKVFVYSSGAETPQNLIIMISGNGGWYGFEQSISNRLADKGISVTGIDIKKCILVFPAIE
jgi:type IV secretory pathway VirJ component